MSMLSKIIIARCIAYDIHGLQMTEPTETAGKKKLAAFRLSKHCLTRLRRAAKRTGKSQAYLLEEAVLAQIAMYINPVKRA